MTISVADLARACDTDEVQFRGSPLTVRAMTPAEIHRVVDALPDPIPPLARDPSCGSQAPLVPNDRDADYRARLSKTMRQRRFCYLAIAAGFVDAQGRAFADVDDSEAKGWCVSVADALAANLSVAENEMLTEAVDRLNRGQKGADPGNS